SPQIWLLFAEWASGLGGAQEAQKKPVEGLGSLLVDEVSGPGDALDPQTGGVGDVEALGELDTDAAVLFPVHVERGDPGPPEPPPAAFATGEERAIVAEHRT